MDKIIESIMPELHTLTEEAMSLRQEYFSSLPIEISKERYINTISESKEMLGEYDFFFEWLTEHSMEQLNELIEKVDEALALIGCRYTITTKS